MSSSDDESSRFGPKKKPYTPKFKEEWKKLPEFASWLCKGKTDILFHCNVCFNDYLGGLSAIKRHSKSEKHRDNSKSVSVSKSINQLPKLVQHTSHEYQIKQAEIKLAMFIAEHNIAFQTSNHVVSLFKSMCPDSSVLQGISCNRTKNTSIVNNVIGQYEFEYLLAIMKSQKFSILIDESTDHSAVKHLAIIVRILDYSNYVVRDNFLCLLQIASATAVNIFEKIKTFFTEHNVPYQSNLVGFASDGANTMFGNRHSVKTLLEEDVPGIFVMKCICHSLALCASYACEKIPNNIQEVVRDVYNYMKQSFKRSSEFKEFQVFVDRKPNKLLQPCQTRWLSLNSCIKRVLEQFDTLKLYFQGEKLIDNKASTIFANLTDPLTKLYLHFLEFVLPMLVDLNVIFQSTKPKIHELYYKMEVVYKMILECYMKPEYLNSTDISKIQYRNPINFLPSEKIYLGGTCTVALENNNLISKTAQEQFRTNCLNFYVECSHQIYKRFPFNAANVQLLKLLSFLNTIKLKIYHQLLLFHQNSKP